MLLVLALVLTMLPAMAISALAETINDDNVFLTQSGSGKCTLTSAVMMLRRRAIIDGNAQWETITEATLGEVAWIGGTGMRYNYSHMGMEVSVESYSGKSDAEKKSALLALLDKHPEGIEIYDGGIPHAVLLTDYDAATDTFYCADPGMAAKRIKLSLSHNASIRGSQDKVIANISQIWYITNKSGGGPGLLTVKLDPNGGKCAEANAYVSADGTVSSLPTPVREGYRFLGWFDAPSGGNKVTGSTPVVKDMTLYAQWKDSTIRGECGDSLSWSLNEDTGVLRISGSGEMNDYHSADGLESPWHDYAAIVKSVVIGQGVKTVGSYAFANLKNLRSVEINAELKRLGSGAFYGCTALSDLDGIEGVRVIGGECFRGCSGLSAIGIPTGCTSVGSYAFAGTAIKSVSVPSSVVSLGEGAFASCRKLAYAELPSGISKVSASLFSGCTALEAFFVKDDGSYGGASLTVEANAFSGCSALRELVIYTRADSLRIAKNAFSGCTGIKSVSLDCRSLVLEDNAFPSGAKIDYINISGELGSVAANAFYGVSTTIVYPANGTKWGEHKGEGFGGSLVWESYDNHVHDYKTTVVAPTCSARGYTVYECKSCTERFNASFVAQLGHSFVNGVCSVCGAKNPFVDIDAKGRHIYFTDAILWAAEKGITTGTSETTFEPGATVTRAQFVTFLWRYLDRPVSGGFGVFADVSSSHFACSAILWAYENGITSGTSATTFEPEGAATRAQVVTFLYRADNSEK